MSAPERLPDDPAERRQIVDGLRFAGWTLQSIGDRFGLTRERIRQISSVPARLVPRDRVHYWCRSCNAEVRQGVRRCESCREAKTHGRSGSAYNRGCRCEECVQANRQRTITYKERNRIWLDADGVSQRPGLLHGTITAYGAFSCRCVPCRGAQAKANRDYKLARKAMRS